MTKLQLPDTSGKLCAYTLQGTPWDAAKPARAFNRVVFSAAHVVADPYANVDPWTGGAIDWDATLAYRRYLADLDLKIAKTINTTQRRMKLS